MHQGRKPLCRGLYNRRRVLLVAAAMFKRSEQALHAPV